MRARWTVTLLATVGVLAIATLFYTMADLPKAERPGITPSSHGVGVLFGSPQYQVKGELVEGGFLDKQLDGKGEMLPPQTSSANIVQLKVASSGLPSKNEQDDMK